MQGPVYVCNKTEGESISCSEEVSILACCKRQRSADKPFRREEGVEDKVKVGKKTVVL